MPTLGPYYSKEELERVWTEEGGDPAAADVASAIALAESGGGAGSWSANPDGNTNWGAWQIDAAQAGDLLTVRGCARAAIARSDNGRNWCAWSTWDGRGCRGSGYDGSYARHLAGALPPPSGGRSGQGGPAISHGPAPLPPPASTGERSWDHSPQLRAAAQARAGHARVLETAARNVLAKLARWRLPG